MKDLIVKVDREFLLTRVVKGVEVVKPTGLMYVDVYFPDGSKHMCGYIGKGLNGAFAPLSRVDRDLAVKIQERINAIAGHAAGDGPAAPEIIEEVEDDILDGDEDES